MNKVILPALLLLAVLSGCIKETASTTPKDPVPVESVEKLADMNQALGWKIFKQELLKKPGENVLISPFSIQTALNMANNGAQGNTLDEILTLMDCKDCAVADINARAADLATLLTEQSGQAKLTVANGFFFDQKRINVKTPFLDALGTHYACAAENLNFDAEQAALDKINGWVNTSTKGKIDKILDQISPLDVAFLINALHFKADWATGFAPQLTQKKPFKKSDGTQVLVDLVQADRNFSFAQTPGFSLVDIPFKDSIFSLSLIQPSATNLDAQWHTNITPASWKAMYDGARYTRAIVYFPRLKLKYENDLIKSLQLLGVKDAFSEQAADFKTMGTAVKNIFINQIKHKTVLEIDEKGAEGAAVTSIGFGITSVPPTFRYDSPFVLVLRHIPTNTMIFTGYVADPTF